MKWQKSYICDNRIKKPERAEVHQLEAAIEIEEVEIQIM